MRNFILLAIVIATSSCNLSPDGTMADSMPSDAMSMYEKEPLSHSKGHLLRCRLIAGHLTDIGGIRCTIDLRNSSDQTYLVSGSMCRRAALSALRIWPDGSPDVLALRGGGSMSMSSDGSRLTRLAPMENFRVDIEWSPDCPGLWTLVALDKANPDNQELRRVDRIDATKCAITCDYRVPVLAEVEGRPKLLGFSKVPCDNTMWLYQHN
jgi:hypothetical protein